MPKGKVKEYNSDRGFGTIVDLETGQSLRVYANNVSLRQGEVLQEGQEVEYKVENNRDRGEAIAVNILEIK